MRLLLDTHSFLWFITDSPRLSQTAKALIENPSNDRLLSSASVWEIAIKVSLGKLELTRPFDELIPQQLLQNKIELLPLEITHFIEVVRLPFHHRDPFDRIIIAQSLVEQLPLISIDPRFDDYGVQRLW